jgi:hypothetical protein
MSILAVCFNIFGDIGKTRIAIYAMGTFYTAHTLTAILVSPRSLFTFKIPGLTLIFRVYFSNARPYPRLLNPATTRRVA